MAGLETSYSTSEFIESSQKGGKKYSWDRPPDLYFDCMDKAETPSLRSVVGVPQVKGGRKYKWDLRKPPDNKFEILDLRDLECQTLPASTGYWVEHTSTGTTETVSGVCPNRNVSTGSLGGRCYKWDFYLAPSPPWLVKCKSK